MINALPYIYVSLFIFFFVLLPQKSGVVIKYYWPKVSIIMVLLYFIGCRGFIVTDWQAYYIYYVNKCPSLWDNIYNVVKFPNTTYFENGFDYYCILIKTFFPNFFVFQFISFLIDVLVLNSIFNEYVEKKYYALSWLLYYLFSGLVIEINLMRNVKSFLIFLYSVKYIREKHLVKYLLCILFACFFHISSVIYLPMYFIINRRYNRKTIIKLFIIGNIIFLFRIRWLSGIIEIVYRVVENTKLGAMIRGYKILSGDDLSYGVGFGFLERTITMILFIIYHNSLIKKYEKLLPFINMMYIFQFICLYCAEFGVFVGRFSLMFVFAYPIVYPSIYNLLKRKDNKALFLVCLLFYSIVKLIALCDEPCYAYTNALKEDQNYELRQAQLNFNFVY